MMTRNNYESIAYILSVNGASVGMVLDFADYLAEDNPRFNRAKFVDAATYQFRKNLEYDAKTLDSIINV